MILRVKRLSPQAKIPEYKSIGASGIDLYSCESISLLPNEYCVVSTGISVEIPLGFEGQIRARSGLALEHGIGVLNSPGTIDSDYRGELKVILFNFSKRRFDIRPGIRIAQLIITRVYKVEIVEDELSPTERGDKGFGSTGTN